MKQPIILSPEIMGGSAVFHGTRVPVQTLLDHLEAGESIDDFLEGFPSVTRAQVIAFLEAADTEAAGGHRTCAAWDGRIHWRRSGKNAAYQTGQMSALSP